MKTEIQINGATRIADFNPSRTEATVDGRTIVVDAAVISPGIYSILLNGRSFDVTVEQSADGWLVRTAGREFQVKCIDPRSWRRAHGGSIELEGRQQVNSPMPGKVVRVLVAAGQKVEAGQGLLVIEAMKMQNEIRSPKTGTVDRIAKEGQTVNAGEIVAAVT